MRGEVIWLTFGGCQLALAIEYNAGDKPGQVIIDRSVPNELRIYVQMGDALISLGTILPTYDQQSNTAGAEFHALSAAPGVRFKYLNVDVTRHVSVPLFPRTDFHIIQNGDRIAAVMIVQVPVKKRKKQKIKRT